MRGYLLILFLFSAGLVFITVYPGICSAQVQHGNGDPVPGEYEILRELEDNPVDPVQSGVAELLMIPDFPHDLAEKIVELAGKEGKDWYENLSGREKKKLASYSRYIEIPSTGVEAGAVARYSVRVCEGRRERRISLLSHLENWRLKARCQKSDSETPVSASITGKLFDRRLDIFGGDFCPDIPIGLLSNSASFSYPFSGSFPMRRSRIISGAVRFYGESLRGAAGIIRLPLIRAAAFAGRRRNEELSYPPGLNYGAVAQFVYSGLEAGTAILEMPANSMKGAHMRYHSEDIEIGFEVAASRDGCIALAGALRFSYCRLGELGFLLYRSDGGFRSSLGRIPGTGRSAGGEKAGMAGVIENRICKKVYAAASIESGSRRVYRSLLRDHSFRARLQRRGKNFSSRIEWKYSLRERKKLVPFPAGPEGSKQRENVLKSISTLRPGDNLQLRLSLRYLRGDSHGIMIYPSLLAGTGAGMFRTDIGAVLYQSFHGNGRFYAYTPSITGRYPWTYLSGTGRFINCRVRLKISNISISLVLSQESGMERKVDVGIISEF